MGEVHQICQDKVFTFEEAKALLPLMKRILADHEAKITKYLADQRYFISTGAGQDKITECDNQICDQMRRLGGKIHKLGVKVYGDGYFGFFTGNMYLSFRWPQDQEITHYHGLFDNPRHVRHPYNQVSKVY